jgi:hypothetical protein
MHLLAQGRSTLIKLPAFEGLAMAVANSIATIAVFTFFSFRRFSPLL